ncbi:hypothetical protein EDC04DRAFT_2609134 [Pisolithus marmoratus]|nr:hypothetical protein EDC04DRAFT_2609134 [Pisolithus marmoratus]
MLPTRCTGSKDLRCICDILVDIKVNEPQALGQDTNNKEVSAISDSNQLEGDTATGHKESANETNPLGQGTMATSNQVVPTHSGIQFIQETMGSGDATKGGERSKEGQAEPNQKTSVEEMEKKLVSAVQDHPTQQVQELMDHIKSHVAKATLDYSLMVIMDNNDLGQGPKLECQQVNLQNMDAKFMASFIKGVDEHGLFNKYIKSALDICVHCKDINMNSLMGAQSPDHPYENHVKWPAGMPQSKAILYNGNHRVTYMQTSPSCVQVFNQHKLALHSMTEVASHAMHEPTLETVRKPEPSSVIGGVWLVHFVDLGHQESVYIETHLAGNQILPGNQDSENDLFHTVMNVLLKMPNMETCHKHINSILKMYPGLKAQFSKPIPAEACEILDNKYFSKWTDQYVSQFHKAQDTMLFEYFASNIPQEQMAYQHQLGNYWTTMIREAEAKCKEGTDQDGNTSEAEGTAACFPIPNKGFLYMLSEQLRHVETAIKETAEMQLKIREDLLGKDFCSGAMKQSQFLKQGITALKAHKECMMTLLHWVDVPAFGDIEAEQWDFLGFLSDVLSHTSFHWLDSGNVKKVETLMKKLMPVCSECLHGDIVASLIIVHGEFQFGHLDILHGFSAQNEVQELNQQKMHQIGVLGTAPNDDQMMIPEVREKLDDLIHTLKVYSEMMVCCLQDPTVAFSADALDLEELEELHPISLPPNNMQALWKSEKSCKADAAKCKADLDRAFHKSKIVEGKATYVHRMAAMKKQAKSAEFVEEDNDEDEDKDSTNADDSDDSPQASPSADKKSAEWSSESWSGW